MHREDGHEKHIIEEGAGGNNRESVPRWLTVHSDREEEIQIEERRLEP